MFLSLSRCEESQSSLSKRPYKRDMCLLHSQWMPDPAPASLSISSKSNWLMENQAQHSQEIIAQVIGPQSPRNWLGDYKFYQ